MKLVFATVAAVAAAVSFKVGTATGARAPLWLKRPAPALAAARPVSKTRTVGARGISMKAYNDVIENYCADCHNDQLKSGNQSFDGFDVAHADQRLVQAEKMIRKLRAEMMPLPGAARPGGDTLALLAQTMEQVIDRSSAKPNPGSRPFQRLNRPEYERTIHDLLGLDVNAADYLPLDTKSANFDNIADVQSLSPTLLEAYLNAAASVSRMAIGDRTASVAQATFVVSPFASQYPWDHVDGTPYGTRGGIVAVNNFPADGTYELRMNVEGGVGMPLEDIDISIEGERVALLKYARGVESTNASADIPLGVDIIRSEPIFIKAGQHKITAAFVRHTDGPYEDLVKPMDWSMASHGTASAGSTTPPQLVDFTITGPTKITGVSESPARKAIFTCRPASKAPAAERACAQQIVTRIGTRAYRRPLTAHDLDGLMSFYTKGAAAGGFEVGVGNALQAILASPHFVFRIEGTPANVAPGEDYQLSDIDLASRLSFFLWGSIPDDQLLNLATQKKLSDPTVLDAQIKRMIADPRSDALSTRFAAQWLRLQDVDKVRPDAFWFPDYNQQLSDDMQTETKLFFNSIVKEDRSVLDLFTADWTFVNERLAKHYGIPNVAGKEFRRVSYPDTTRRGLLGQGSVLVQTSLANRTSPVLRGKWVMEVLIGMPPPPPPPNVPTLDETSDAKDGRQLTTRERVELHRKNPACSTCHQYMDPIGLSLDNFDVTGKYRYRENAMLLDTRGNLYDGTPVGSETELVKALLRRPIPMVRSFTENLMAYALGRRVEDFDQPTVRAIVREAQANNYRMSSFITSIVHSSAFRSKRADAAVAADTKTER
jgi:hypothetical protein